MPLAPGDAAGGAPVSAPCPLFPPPGSREETAPEPTPHVSKSGILLYYGGSGPEERNNGANEPLASRKLARCRRSRDGAGAPPRGLARVALAGDRRRDRR